MKNKLLYPKTLFLGLMLLCFMPLLSFDVFAQTIQFTSTSGSVNETDGSTSIEVSITGFSGFHICDVILQNGNSADINGFTTQTLFFLNPNPQTVPITITDDLLEEGAENLVFGFTNFTNATAGTPSQFTLTINDDEPNPDVIITEIMQNPNAVLDNDGEWFEIYNNGSTDVDINGWIVKDNDSDSIVINNGGTLTVNPGNFAVLSNNADGGTNGGITVVDYEYSGFTLANTVDEIVLTTSGETEIDRVEYDNGVTFPSVANGASMILLNFTLDNNVGANWGTSTEAYGLGDFGTPGSLGGEAALPVELFSFKGSAKANGVQLNWTTASETDNAGFTLLRNGVEVANFNNTNALKGQGTTSSHTRYSYVDQSATLGSYVYTLRSEDYSGLIHDYNMTVTVEVTELDGGVSVEPSYALDQNYPNPFNPSTTIKYTMKEAGEATLKVYDVLGRQVFEQTKVSVKGDNNSINFNASGLTSGMYFYQMTTEGFTSQMKRMILVK